MSSPVVRPHPPTASPPTEPHGGTAPAAGAGHIPALDGLRGSAMLAVMLLHLTAELSDPVSAPARLVKQAFSLGWAGVDVFFVLSGFLITGILADARETPHRYRNFYARRALRVLPLYYGYIVLLFAVPALVGARAYITSPGDQLPYWVYLQNFRPLTGPAFELASHLWSLAIEEQFYLIWPLMVFTLSRTAALRVCALCIAGAVAFRVTGVFMVEDLRTLYVLTPGRVDGLALGGAIALVMRGSGGPRRLRRMAPAVLALSAVAIAGAALHPSRFHPAGVYMVTVGYTALACFFGAVLVLALDGGRSILPRLLSTKVLRFFGRYSYALYVLHLPLVVLGRRVGVSPNAFAGTRWELAGLLGYVVLMGAVSILLALASWNLYESRFLRLKSRFPYRTG